MTGDSESTRRPGSPGRRRRGRDVPEDQPEDEPQETAEEQIRVEVTAHELDSALVSEARASLVEHGLVREALGDGELRIAGFDVLDKDPSPSSAFIALVYDPQSTRAVRLHGRLDDVERASVTSTAYQPQVTEDEFADAVSAVLGNDELSTAIENDQMQAYRPMPPVANIENPDGTIERVVTVGLRSEVSELRHRIVGVRMRDRTVIPNPAGVAQPSGFDCEPARYQGGCSPTPGTNQVRVKVLAGHTVLWDLVVVRPSASSGTNGSGIELRYVDYRGKRVLFRAHLPILNVEYETQGIQQGCGPTYRDWQNYETCFHAVGTDPFPGFRVCSAPPQSILDSGVDGGNFSGVALWFDGRSLLLLSQLSAGWYRYISEWHLDANGTIRPRFGFAGTANPCTCTLHTHHCYWRFDFDIITAWNNIVEEHNDPPIIGTSKWHTKRYEIRRLRDAAHKRYWRVRNGSSFEGYLMLPNAGDGTPSSYGEGDVWVLRYHPTEIDDGQGFTTNPALSRAHLDNFLTGELVQRQDVVLWYAGHFHHDEAHSPGGHRLGPDLKPFNW